MSSNDVSCAVVRSRGKCASASASRHAHFTAEFGTRSLKIRNPLYYNSLLDTHTKRYRCRDSVRSHLVRAGFLSRQGLAYPSREELLETSRQCRLRRQQKDVLRGAEKREGKRLQRLRVAAGVGRVLFTSDGIVDLPKGRAEFPPIVSTYKEPVMAASRKSASKPKYGCKNKKKVSCKIIFRTSRREGVAQRS